MLFKHTHTMGNRPQWLTFGRVGVGQAFSNSTELKSP